MNTDADGPGYTRALVHNYSRRMRDADGVVASFEAKLRELKSWQEAALAAILRRHAHTDYGRRFGFADIAGYADYRSRVPVVSYEALAPYVERMRGDEPDVLIRGQASFFSTTSGFEASPKLVPGTHRTVISTCETILARNAYLRRDHPRAFAGRPLFIPGSMAPGKGVGHGAVTGFGYYVGHMGFEGPPLPCHLFSLPDLEVRHYCILRMALARRDLSALFVFNPRSLVLVLEAASRMWTALLDDIGDGVVARRHGLPEDLRSALSADVTPDPARAAELRRAGDHRPREWWPQLAVLVSARGGPAGFYLGELRRWLGDLPARDLGILTAEAMLTVPVDDATAGGVLLPDTGFFEFVPADASDEAACPAWQLTPGVPYRVLVTTCGGLYRYALGVVVRVDRWFAGAPVLEFLGREHATQSLAEPAHSEHQVARAVRAAAEAAELRLAGFTAVTASDRRPHYEVCAEIDARPTWQACNRFAWRVDDELKAANLDYASNRDMGRLGPARLALLAPGSFAKLRGQDADVESHLASAPGLAPQLQVIARIPW